MALPRGSSRVVGCPDGRWVPRQAACFFEHVLLLPQLPAVVATDVLRLLDSSSSLLRALGGKRSVVGLEAVGGP